MLDRQLAFIIVAICMAMQITTPVAAQQASQPVLTLRIFMLQVNLSRSLSELADGLKKGLSSDLLSEMKMEDTPI